MGDDALFCACPPGLGLSTCLRKFTSLSTLFTSILVTSASAAALVQHICPTIKWLSLLPCSQNQFSTCDEGKAPSEHTAWYVGQGLAGRSKGWPLTNAPLRPAQDFKLSIYMKIMMPKNEMPRNPPPSTCACILPDTPTPHAPDTSQAVMP